MEAKESLCSTFTYPATHISVMPSTKIDDDAISKLKSLAAWVHESAKMKEKKNLLQCVDKDRLEKTLPLLNVLGYDQIEVRR
jgi:hypothetical protein